MATSFPPTIWGIDDDDIEARDFIVDGSATFKKGEFVYWDTSSQTLKGCGADPSLIAGITQGSAAFSLGTEWPGPVSQGNRVGVFVLEPGALLFMASTTAPTKAHIGNKYGITKDANNNWLVDTGKTAGSARLIVVDIFQAVSTTVTPGPQTGQEGFLCRLGGSSYLQFSGIF